MNKKFRILYKTQWTLKSDSSFKLFNRVFLRPTSPTTFQLNFGHFQCTFTFFFLFFLTKTTKWKKKFKLKRWKLKRKVHLQAFFFCLSTQTMPQVKTKMRCNIDFITRTSCFLLLLHWWRWRGKKIYILSKPQFKLAHIRT